MSGVERLLLFILTIIMEEIYRNVSARMRELVPGLETVCLDCGQIDEPWGSELALPAALVEVSYPECTDMTRLTQQCRVEVSVRVAVRVGPKSESVLSLTEEIYDALQGWTDDSLCCLSRRSQVPERRNDGLKVVCLTFDSAFEEQE